MARQRTKNPAPAAPTAVTGVASGGLGTAANLEDTQLWDLEDLRAADPADEFEPEELPEPAPMRAAPALPPAEPPARLAEPMRPVAQPVSAAVVRVPRGQRRTGLVAAAAVGIIALAALLALRDGLPGGANRGAGDAAGAFPSLPPAASIGPQATAAPDAGGSGGGKGHGNGGNGNGNGHGNN
jgi:hypothetical protein